MNEPLSAENVVSRANWCERHKCAKDRESDCHVCHGEGVVEDHDDVIGRGTETCWSCRGSGRSPWLDCEWCLEESDDDYA